jgi:hypothetical protein
MMATADGVLFTGHSDGSVNVWNLQTRKVQQLSAAGHAAAPITALAQSEAWVVWADATGQTLAQHGGTAARIAVAPADATGSGSGSGGGGGGGSSVSALVFPSVIAGHSAVVVSGSSSGVLRAFVLDSATATAEKKMEIDLKPLIVSAVGASLPRVQVTANDEIYLAVDSAAQLGLDQPVRVFALCSTLAQMQGAVQQRYSLTNVRLFNRTNLELHSPGLFLPFQPQIG